MCHVGQSFLAELLAEGLACVMQVAGYHFFQQHATAGAGRVQGQPAAQRAGSDNRDGRQPIFKRAALRAIGLPLCWV